MLKHWFESYQFVHGLLAILAAIAFFRLWKLTRFWLPKYVHVLAAIGFVVGVAIVWLISQAPRLPDPHGPSTRTQHITLLLLPLMFPAMVYFFFVFYGGQHAALSSRLGSSPCPFCGTPLPALRASGSSICFVESACTACWHPLNSTTP